MKKSLAIGMILIVAILFAVSFAGAAENDGGPPFKSGELVVAGAPGTHLDRFEIVKYLPHANLTVIKVEKGKEFGMAQRFLGRGHRASLNYTVHASSEIIPNDPYYGPNQWNFTAIQSEAAWVLSTGGDPDPDSKNKVIVAVLDTGLGPASREKHGEAVRIVVSPVASLSNGRAPKLASPKNQGIV